MYKFDDQAIYRYIRVQTKLDITCVCTIQVHTGQLNLSFKFAGHEKGRLTHYNRTEMLDKLTP